MISGAQTGRFCLLVLALSLLSACGHLREQSDATPPGWAEQTARQRALSAWYVEGRLGVQTATQAGSLDVFWNQQAQCYQIRLIAPLGQGAFLVTGDADSARLQTSNGDIRSAASADQLFAESLGVTLPLASLRSWLRGLPAAGDSELVWDEQGHLYIIEQDGWRVELARYKQQDGLILPHAFYLSRRDQPELMIRLLLRSWQLHDLPALAP